MSHRTLFGQPKLKFNSSKFEEIVSAFTPKEFRHIAQGCSRCELPWGWRRNGGCTPKGFRHWYFLKDATLSG